MMELTRRRFLRTAGATAATLTPSHREFALAAHGQAAPATLLLPKHVFPLQFWPPKVGDEALLVGVLNALSSPEGIG